MLSFLILAANPKDAILAPNLTHPLSFRQLTLALLTRCRPLSVFTTASLSSTVPEVDGQDAHIVTWPSDDEFAGNLTLSTFTRTISQHLQYSWTSAALPADTLFSPRPIAKHFYPLYKLPLINDDVVASLLRESTGSNRSMFSRTLSSSACTHCRVLLKP